MWKTKAGVGNEKDDVENAKDLIIRVIQYKC